MAQRYGFFTKSIYRSNPLDTSEDEIRLVEIDLVKGSKTVKYHLRSNVSLRKTQPVYTALSYCWGREKFQAQLEISGAKVMVSNNLIKALDDVVSFWQDIYAHKGKPLLLWCDQLCIDQSNDEEKNHQVAYMGQIYARAEEVLIWLSPPEYLGVWPSLSRKEISGTSTPPLWSAWKTWHLHQVHSLRQRGGYKSAERMEYSQNSLESQTSQIKGQATPADVSLTDLKKGFSNILAVTESPWWQRTWVFQEFILATRATFLVAGMWAPWRDMHTLLSAYAAKVQAAKAIVDTEEELLRTERHPTWYGAMTCVHTCTPASSWLYSMAKHRRSDARLCLEFSGAILGYIQELLCELDWWNGWTDIIYLPFKILFFGLQLILGSLACIITTIAAAIVLLASGCCWICSCRPAFEAAEKAHATRQEKQLNLQMAKSESVAALSEVVLAAIETDKWSIIASIFQTKLSRDLPTNSGSLSALLMHARSTLCTDNKDKVYAFLGLVDKALDYGLSPDYSITDDRRVLQQAVVSIIENERNLNFIQQAFGDRRSVNSKTNLPSWMPDLFVKANRQQEHLEFLKCFKLDISQWQASKGEAPRVSFGEDVYGTYRPALHAEGIRVDTLSSLEFDPDHEPWRRFKGTSGLQIITRNTASVGNEVWVLLGLNVPLTLSRIASDTSVYTILGCAMIWDDNNSPSKILQGSLIDDLKAGKVSTETVTIV